MECREKYKDSVDKAEINENQNSSGPVAAIFQAHDTDYALVTTTITSHAISRLGACIPRRLFFILLLGGDPREATMRREQ